MSLLSFFSGAMDRSRVKSTVDDYARQFDEATAASRKDEAAGIARDYYQLVTDFYEYGWGQSFHFAPRARGEPMAESLRRYEQHLAVRLGLSSEHRVLDVGCGVAGPLRTIARFSGAAVTGVTISPYQVQRARAKLAAEGLSGRCEVVEADFNALPFPDGSYDAAYTIEACCHAADRRGPFAEVFRVLKPGARFAGYDWCLTDRFVPGQADHERIKLGIEKGNGVATLKSTAELERALTDVGFEVLDATDWARTSHPELPWYSPLAAGVSVNGFRNSRLGAFISHQLVKSLEATGLSPKGTVQTHDVLRLAQRALVEGGTLGIFTPMYFWVARKPA